MTAAHSVKLLKHIDLACDRFEEHWLAGRQPRIEDYVAEVSPADRLAVLHALSQVQQELVLKQLESLADEVEFVEATPDEVAESASFIEAPTQVDRPGNDACAGVILTVTAGPHQGQTFEFDRHETLLAGRSPKATLRLENDPHFSRHHFRLEVNPPLVHLIDLDSRNGTFVNGTRIHERTLAHGDLISGGQTVLQLSIDDTARTLDASPIGHHAPRPTVSSINPSIETPPAATTPTVTTPSIPGYEILEILGRGPLGTTHRARQRTTNLECAIKILQPSGQISERSIQTFLREARVLNQLNHRNLIRLRDMGAANGTLYLVTEFVSVMPWDEVLAVATSEARIRMACGVACQILDGLQYAHTRSLVHRDIQPSNILVVRQDRKLIAKLADFGFAKSYIDAGFSQITHDGAIIGSLPYMSPEQFMDSRHAKPACDIYSMGATLYRLLTGHDPFVFDKTRCKFLAILEDDPIPLRQSFPQVPAGLAAIVHRALAKEPAERFASAAEMRHALLPFSRRNP